MMAKKSIENHADGVGGYVLRSSFYFPVMEGATVLSRRVIGPPLVAPLPPSSSYMEPPHVASKVY
jgi:hypothetical protein